MSTLGVYFGSKSVNGVLTQGKKVIANISIPMLSAPVDDLEAKTSYEDKTIEVIAAFKESFRRNKISLKDVTISLSGKDLLIRTFEIPDLPREELQGVINFEVKKYIPFKIEELNTDFQTESIKGEKTKLALFAGIKRDVLEKYLNLFSQLGMKVKAIEYAPVSLLRIVKLAGLVDAGITGTIFLDSKGEDESNFLVTENGFPLFARDITLMGAMEGLATASPEGSAEFLEKIKTEIRISLDYYNRKFPSRNVKKIFVISSQAHFIDLQAYLAETGITAKFIDTAKVLGTTDDFSAGAIKGYATSLAGLIRTKVNLDLLKVKATPKISGARAPMISLKDIKLKLKFDFRLILLGLLVCAGVFGWGMLNKAPLNTELQTLVMKRTPVEGVSPTSTLKELQLIDSEYKTKLANLDDLLSSQVYLTVPLNVIPHVLPEGIWLEKISFNQKAGNISELTLDGMAYLADSDKELEAVNNFLLALKNSIDFSNSFKEIKMASVNSAVVNKYNTTHFVITCNAYIENKVAKKPVKKATNKAGRR